MSACLAEPDPGAMACCIQIDIDCAQRCRLAASYLGRDSGNAKLLCEDRAEVCDRCAGECERHASPHCRAWLQRRASAVSTRRTQYAAPIGSTASLKS